MTPIHGSDCLFSIQVGSDFYPLLCATNFSLTLNQEIVGATNAATGNWRHNRPRNLSDYSLSMSGLTKVNNDDGQISWFYMMRENVRAAAQNYQLLFEDKEGNTLVISGSLLIQTMDLQAAVTDFVNSNINMLGTGAFEQSTVIPTPSTECEEPFADDWVLAEGETTISGPGLGGKSFATGDILSVSLEGSELTYSAGVPGNAEYSYNGTEITVQYPAPEGGQRVHVIWKNIIASS